MGMGMAEILREVCGNGDRCCGNTAGTEIGAVGMPRGVEFVFLRELLRCWSTAVQLSAKFCYDILCMAKGLNTTSMGMGGDGTTLV